MESDDVEVCRTSGKHKLFAQAEELNLPQDSGGFKMIGERNYKESKWEMKGP